MKDLPAEAAALLARARAEHEPTSRQLATTLDKLHHSLEFAPEVAPLPRHEPTFSTNTVARGGRLTMRAKAALLMVVVGGLAAVATRMPLPKAERDATEAAPSSTPSSVKSVDRSAVVEQRLAAEVQRASAERDVAPGPPAVARPTARASLQKAEQLVQKAEQPVRRTLVSPHPTHQRARAAASKDPVGNTTESTSPGSTTSQPRHGALAARIDLDRSSWEELEPPVPSELELIDDALSSLRDHDPRRSLALLAQHAELYPDGMLATERRGLRVLALCALGDRVRAGRERAAYLSTAAQTPLAERVRRTCRPDGQP